MSRRPEVPVLLAALVLAGCGGGHRSVPARGEPLSGVATEILSEGTWSGAYDATGTLEPARRAAPGTILAGRVTEVIRREGDRVRGGDVLARVESGEVAARAAAAEAAVAAAREAEGNARRMRERLERLVAKQAASPKSLEDAVAGHEAAIAGLRAAEEGVRAARVMLGYGRIVAPFDGVVVARHVEEGDVAGPGVPMFVVEETSRMKVEASLPESRVAGLKAGDGVLVSVDALAGATREATISEILPANDPATRTATVRVLLDNTSGVLRAGTFARVRFPGTSRTTLAVPESAIVRRGPLEGVFVVDEGGVARLRWLTLGAPDAGRVEVLAGVAAGERVVISPPPELADGRAIEGAP